MTKKFFFVEFSRKFGTCHKKVGPQMSNHAELGGWGWFFGGKNARKMEVFGRELAVRGSADKKYFFFRNQHKILSLSQKINALNIILKQF